MAVTPAAEAATVTASSEPHASTAQLVLVGTLLQHDGDDRRGLALIGEHGSDARWFAVNQEVAPATTLVEVELHSVRLRHEGTVVELVLSSHAGEFGPAEPAPTPAQPAHADAFAELVPGIVPLSAHYFSVSRTVVSDHLRSPELFANNEAFFLDEGGLFIARMGHASILEKVGLRVGDVVTAVDGKALNGLLDLPGLGLLIRSKDLERLDLDLIRHGARERVTYELSD